MPTTPNGYPASQDPAEIGIVDFIVDGVRFEPGVRGGDVATVLYYVASQVAARVERPSSRYGCWGYSYRANVNDPMVLSNHSSGTAIDYNAELHANGFPTTRVWTAAQIAEIHAILDEVDNAVRWGGDYSGTPDAMHFEINVDEATLATVAASLGGPPPSGAFALAGTYPIGDSLNTGLYGVQSPEGDVLVFIDTYNVIQAVRIEADGTLTLGEEFAVEATGYDLRQVDFARPDILFFNWTAVGASHSELRTALLGSDLSIAAVDTMLYDEDRAGDPLDPNPYYTHPWNFGFASDPTTGMIESRNLLSGAYLTWSQHVVSAAGEIGADVGGLASGSGVGRVFDTSGSFSHDWTLTLNIDTGAMKVVRIGFPDTVGVSMSLPTPPGEDAGSRLLIQRAHSDWGHRQGGSTGTGEVLAFQYFGVWGEEVRTWITRLSWTGSTITSNHVLWGAAADPRYATILPDGTVVGVRRDDVGDPYLDVDLFGSVSSILVEPPAGTFPLAGLWWTSDGNIVVAHESSSAPQQLSVYVPTTLEPDIFGDFTYTVDEYGVFTFDATNLTSSNGVIISYVWNFNDGVDDEDWLGVDQPDDGVIVDHEFPPPPTTTGGGGGTPTPGGTTHEVTVTVTTDTGDVATVTHTVFVPGAAISGRVSGSRRVFT